MGRKYQVIQLLWSPSQNRYIQIGEIVELEDDIAKILLQKDCIKPYLLRIEKTKIEIVEPDEAPIKKTRKRSKK